MWTMQTFSSNDKSFTVNAYMSCTVKQKVIYVIECRGCGEYYIGETNYFRKRNTLHNQHIRHKNLRMIPVCGLIATCSDKDPKYFMFPLYEMSFDSFLARKEDEKIFY